MLRGYWGNITCYVARHTFSTVMKRSGASTEFIQEAPGHTNIKTTENYVDSFEKELKKEFANRLVSFKERKLLGAQWQIQNDRQLLIIFLEEAFL